LPDQLANRLLLIAAAVLFSTGGAAIKAISLSPWQIASFRSAIAAAALIVLLPEARRGWSWRLIPACIAYASTLVAFVVATKLTTAANAIFLQSAAPLYLLLIGPLLLKERIRRPDLLFAAAVAGGVTLMLFGDEPASATAPDPRTGNLIAAFSGVAWAFTIAALRWLGKRGEGENSLAAVAVGNLTAGLVALPLAFPLEVIHVSDIGALLYLGFIQIGLAYVCLTRGLRGVTAFEASALLLVEPALNPVWAWLLHAEVPGGWAVGGGAAILSAILLRNWKRKVRRQFPLA
jgi:drug/metabolite transporter, DME family